MSKIAPTSSWGTDSVWNMLNGIPMSNFVNLYRSATSTSECGSLKECKGYIDRERNVNYIFKTLQTIIYYKFNEYEKV